MPYYEITHSLLGYSLNGPLDPLSQINGRVGRNYVDVEVLEDGKSVALNGVVREGEKGAVLFDSTLTTHRALVYLDEPTSDRLLLNQICQIPGVFQDQLTGIYRRAQEQVGARKPGQRSFDEIVTGILSAGTTEDF